MRHRLTGLNYSHHPSFRIGQVLEGFGVSEVVQSANPNFKPGDHVTSWTKWEEYSVIAEGKGLKLIDRSVAAPLSYYVGALGMPGFTAYVGLYEVLKPKKGETIFVSAASGAVGQMVGQLAREAGLYVVGSAGSQDKIKLLTSKLGYNAAFNYKEEEDINAALKKYCPRGIDMYFENVGGKTLDAVIDNMNPFGRVAVCGLIAQWTDGKAEGGLLNLYQLISKRIRMQGFFQSDYQHLQPKFMELVAGYVKQDKLVYLEDIAQGLENAPDAFCRMMKGSKIGKQIIQVM
jgi:NADPH-dependent curcumin reductase CurA